MNRTKRQVSYDCQKATRAANGRHGLGCANTDIAYGTARMTRELRVILHGSRRPRGQTHKRTPSKELHATLCVLR